MSEGFFIDFEGEQTGPPVLIGVLGISSALGDNDGFRQFVFDEDLQRLGASSSTDHGCCVNVTAEESLRRIREAIETTRLPVYAWSSYEETTILGLVATEEDRDFWTGRVTDAKAIAKRWKRKHHPDVVFQLTRGSGRHALRHYLKLIDYKIPPTQQGGLTGQRIRDARNAIVKRGDWASMTPVQKRKWRSLLAHNWHDCNGMRELMRICHMG